MTSATEVKHELQAFDPKWQEGYSLLCELETFIHNWDNLESKSDESGGLCYWLEEEVKGLRDIYESDKAIAQSPGPHSSQEDTEWEGSDAGLNEDGPLTAESIAQIIKAYPQIMVYIERKSKGERALFSWRNGHEAEDDSNRVNNDTSIGVQSPLQTTQCMTQRTESTRAPSSAPPYANSMA